MDTIKEELKTAAQDVDTDELVEAAALLAEEAGETLALAATVKHICVPS